MEPMSIRKLQEYAQNHGHNSGRFIAVTEKGICEFQWLDAFFGFLQVVTNGEISKEFISVNQLEDLLGEDQKYLATVGYDDDEEEW